MSREEKLLFAKEKLREFQKQKKLKEGQAVNQPETAPPQPKNSTELKNLTDEPKKEETARKLPESGQSQNENSQYLHSLTEEYARKNEYLYKELLKANNRISELKEDNSRLETAKSVESANNVAQMAAEENYIRTVGDLVAEKTELLTKLSLSESRLESVESQLHSANVRVKIAEQNLLTLSESHKRMSLESEAHQSSRNDHQTEIDSLQMELRTLREKTTLNERDVETFRANLHKKSLQVVQYEAEIKSLQSQVNKFVNTCSKSNSDEFKHLQEDYASLKRESEAQRERIDELTSAISAERSSFAQECSKMRQKQSEMERKDSELKSLYNAKVAEFDDVVAMYNHCVASLEESKAGGSEDDVEGKLTKFLLDIGMERGSLPVSVDVDTFLGIIGDTLLQSHTVRQNMERAIENATRDNDELKGTICGLREEETKLKSDLGDLRAHTEELQSDKLRESTKMREEIEALKDHIMDLTDQLELNEKVEGKGDVERLRRTVQELEGQNKAISSYVVLYREQRHILNHKVTAKEEVIKEQKREFEDYRQKMSKIRFLVRSLLSRHCHDVNLETANSILDLTTGSEGDVGEVREGMKSEEIVEEISEIVKVCDVVDRIPIERLCKDCKGPIYIA